MLYLPLNIDASSTTSTLEVEVSDQQQPEKLSSSFFWKKKKTEIKETDNTSPENQRTWSKCLWNCCSATAVITTDALAQGGVTILADIIDRKPAAAVLDTAKAFQEAYNNYIQAKKAEDESKKKEVEQNSPDTKTASKFRIFKRTSSLHSNGISEDRLKAEGHLMTLMDVLLDSFLMKFEQNPQHTLETINTDRAISSLVDFLDLFKPSLDTDIRDKSSLETLATIWDIKSAVAKVLAANGDKHTHLETIRASISLLRIQNLSELVDIKKNAILDKIILVCDKIDSASQSSIHLVLTPPKEASEEEKEN